MAIDWSVLKFGKGEPLALSKHRKRAKADADLESAYRDVDARDDSVCWVTQVKTSAGAVDPKRRREHHHLAGRRVQPSWVTNPDHIITVSAFVHDLITRGALIVEGSDARKPIFFHWNRRIVKPGKEPFRLKVAA